MSALICIFTENGAQLVPALASLIPPARRDFASIEILEVVEAVVPVVKPGANTSLLFGPRGRQDGGTSSVMRFDVNPHPASFPNFYGASAKLAR